MDRIPPELLSRIFSLALPPHYLSTFPERASTLRAFSLTCRQWRAPAQRLLLRRPIVLNPGVNRTMLAQFQSFCSSVREGDWQVDSLGIEWVTYQEKRPNRSGLIGSLLQSKATENLKSLSLKLLALDPRTLLGLKNLRTLTLCDVQFGEESTNSASHNFQLPQLEHLSLIRCPEVPPCLLLPQLPSLTALALEDHDAATLAAIDYLLEHPSSHSLRHFSVPIETLLRISFTPAMWDDMMLKLPSFTLVDFPIFDLFDRLPTEIPVEHIYFNIQEDPSNMYIHMMEEIWRTFWEADLEEVCPNLKTVVIPSRWQSLAEEQYALITAFTERKKVTLLIEEEYDLKGESERQLSRAFMKYRGIL